MAESRPGTAPAGGGVSANSVPDDQAAGNSGGSRTDAGRSAPDVPGGEAGDAAHHPEFFATGWECEREAFFRNLRNPAKQSQIYGSNYFGAGQEAQKTPDHHLDGIGATLGAGLRVLASAGGLIEDSSEDPDERRKRLEAEQAGSNAGTVLGLAIGAAMALTKPEAEEHVIRDQQEFNEFLAQMEVDEENQGIQFPT